MKVSYFGILNNPLSIIQYSPSSNGDVTSFFGTNYMGKIKVVSSIVGVWRIKYKITPKQHLTI